MSMVLTLKIPEAEELRIKHLATVRGLSVDDYVSELVIRRAGEGKTFDEIAAPFAASFAESGCSEEELDAIIQKARQEIWDEQQTHSS